MNRMVQVGVVQDTDQEKHRVRVKHPDTGIISGWLNVVQHTGTPVEIKEDGSHRHSDPDGGSTGSAGTHSHEGSSTGPWMPKTNDRVLVLYSPGLNSDGYVLGGL